MSTAGDDNLRGSSLLYMRALPVDAARGRSIYARGFRLTATFASLCALQACNAGTPSAGGPPTENRPSAPATSPPVLYGAITGARQTVFDTRNGCEQIDIPDAPARAFRDARGLVHLFATHYVARAMIGPGLSDVRHDCHIVYRSPKDTQPEDFQYNNWLFSFYSEDGRRVAALVHSEYDAEEIPGQCATPEKTDNCWWNTVTFAESNNGGQSFEEPPPPHNLVAALPYRYEVGNLESAYGYSGPSNILKLGEFYYALINDWPYRLQEYGPCLIRTKDVFNPASWRAWDGHDFRVRFADPYRETVDKLEDYVCVPVLAGAADSLVKNAKSNTFLVTQFAPDERFEGPPGFYIQGSHDLIHWSKPSLLVKFSDLRAEDGPGKWTYGYDSLLDPASADRNFSTVSETPYLYYVRSDGDHPPYARVLFRRQIKVKILN